jgi:hypothetical protein
MKKTALLFNVFLVLGLLLATNTKAVMAGPHQEFSPATGNYTVGENFSVTVKMTSGGEIIGGADGTGTYDATRLELISIEEAPSLVFNTTEDKGSCNIYSESDLGDFSYSCYSLRNTSANSNSGDLVVFNFKAKATGTALVKFNCVQDSTTDTNIFTTNPVKEVLVCGENINGSYIIAAGSGGNTPTSAPAVTQTVSSEVDSETDELPKTGVIGATLGLILFGAVSVVSAFFLKFL